MLEALLNFKAISQNIVSIFAVYNNKSCLFHQEGDQLDGRAVQTWHLLRPLPILVGDKQRLLLRG